MHQNESNDNRQTLDYWKTEYNGLILEHQQMWNHFSGSLKLYLGIVTIPITLMVSLSNITDAPHFYDICKAVCLVISLVGFLFIMIIIHHRLDVILYAKLLNGLRSALSTTHPDIYSLINTAKIPSDPDIPKNFELWRPMFLFVTLGAVINSIYLYFFFNFPNIILGPLLGFIAASIIIHIATYWGLCSRTRIAGERMKQKKKG